MKKTPEDLKLLSKQIANEKYINSEVARLKSEKLLRSKKISDGYHTFDDLYFVRMVMTKVIAETYKSFSVKSKKHHDNENDPMFEGSFIVVIETPKGQISYHYHLAHWDYFNIPEVLEAPKYDGHDTNDVIRLESLLETKEKQYLLITSVEREFTYMYFNDFDSMLEYVVSNELDYIKNHCKDHDILEEFENQNFLKLESVSFTDSSDNVGLSFDKENKILEGYSNLNNLNVDYKSIKIN